jgi:hypothetical protein
MKGFCNATLEVRTTGRAVVLPLRRVSAAFSPAIPQLLGLANIDRAPGLEIVMDVSEGASTVSAGNFTLRKDQIERMTIRPRTFDPNVFLIAGGLSGIGGVDCLQPGSGRVVYSSTGALSGKTTRVDRSFYTASGTQFILRHKAKTRGSSDPVRLGGQFPELVNGGDEAFPSCMDVRESR